MAPPPVTIYVTSLTSQPKVRQHTDLLHRSLKALEIPYEAFDLVMDQDAKTRWQRAKPPGMVVGLPGYLVGGEWVGTMEDFEYAVESQTLPQFLKQDADAGVSAPTVGEAELERLIREMSEADLDALAGELGVDENKTKVGLMVPEGANAGPENQSGPAVAAASVPEDEALEAEGIKGTVERVVNPDLEQEKKMAEVEVAGPIPRNEKKEGEEEGEGVGEVAAAVASKVEDAIVGAEKDVPAGKEKLD